VALCLRRRRRTRGPLAVTDDGQDGPASVGPPKGDPPWTSIPIGKSPRPFMVWGDCLFGNDRQLPWHDIRKPAPQSFDLAASAIMPSILGGKVMQSWPALVPEMVASARSTRRLRRRPNLGIRSDSAGILVDAGTGAGLVYSWRFLGAVRMGRRENRGSFQGNGSPLAVVLQSAGSRALGLRCLDVRGQQLRKPSGNGRVIPWSDAYYFIWFAREDPISAASRSTCFGPARILPDADQLQWEIPNPEPSRRHPDCRPGFIYRLLEQEPASAVLLLVLASLAGDRRPRRFPGNRVAGPSPESRSSSGIRGTMRPAVALVASWPCCTRRGKASRVTDRRYLLGRPAGLLR